VNAIWAFLHTTENGDGWANAGQRTLIPLPQDAVGLLNRDGVWYEAPYGAVPVRRDDIPEQFKRFMRFVDAIYSVAGKDGSRLNVSSPHDRLGPSLLRLLQYAKTKRDHYSEKWWYLNRVLKFYTYNSLYIPFDGVAPKENDYEVVMLPLNGAYSALAYGAFDGRQDITAPIEVVHAGWRVQQDFEGLVNAWHHVNEFMTDDIFSRWDKIKKSLDMSDDSTGLITMLRGRLVAERDFVSVNMPDDQYVTKDFIDRRKLVRRFFVNNKLAYRIADEIVYKFNPPEEKRPGFARLIDYSGAPARVFTYSQLQDLIANEKYAELLRDARNAGLVIHFKIPTTFKMIRTKDFTPQGSIIQFATNSTYLKFKDTKFEYIEDDVILDDTRKEIAEREYDSWGVDVDPFIAHDESFIRSLFNFIEVDKEKRQFITQVKFVSNQ
jgi:hypothetical protein